MSTGDTEHDIQWALDILTPRPDYEPNLLAKHWHNIICPIIGVTGIAWTNYYQGRPVLASIHRYPLAIAGSLVIAKVLNHFKFQREARRDAMLRHYIKLHPEDFPPPERKKWGEVFNDWVPLGR